MKNFTREIKKESKNDIGRILTHNNSKAAKRTPEQNEQARNDKYNYYKNKWEHLLEQCETKAQKAYCEMVLKSLNQIR